MDQQAAQNRPVGERSPEMDYLVRALSHDMTANFMLLEDSLQQLKRDHARDPLAGLAENFAHVEACLRESKRFLDDLVLLGRTGTVDMHSEPVELAPLVREVVFEQQALLDARRIECRVAERLPVVWCNEVRVRQVFTNLVRNAALHGCDSRDPRIEIECFEALAPLSRGRVWFCVRDNGPGIPAANRREIFLPGRRLPQAEASGSGLGLAIVRRIVEYYGGTIFVDPVCVHGTAILFSLPAVPAELDVAAAAQSPKAAIKAPHLRRSPTVQRNRG